MSMNNERSSLLLGEENTRILHTKTVMVIGLGGVGSFCVEALARSGIGHLILVDKDTIEESNLNRQLIATTETVGRNKAEALKERIKTIAPDCMVESHVCFYDKEKDETLFNQSIDFVIDCIDSIQSKQNLIEACLNREIPFLCSMGTARRMDPTQLKVMELEKTSYDPIAKRLRNWKRKSHIHKKIWVVSSMEPAIPVDASLPLPSMIFVPGTAGLLLANECVKRLIQKQ